MKPLFFYVGLVSLLMQTQVSAQQWIDQKYSYDSTYNIEYGTAINFNGSLDTLHLDLFTPVCDDVDHVSRRPLVIFIHGGAFLAGDKYDPSIVSLCKNFAKRGYVTATIDYRLGFIADDAAWSCNYPNYSCVFGSDTAEWYRSYFRAVQDAKGALRFLVNHHEAYRIDTNNVFLVGESAGAFLALGAALMDTVAEKFPEAYAMPDAPKPVLSAQSCLYSADESFDLDMIPRPDLGSIDGDIAPSTVHYTIKGIGNMYGAMLNDLLKFNAYDKPKPAIYSFHQPCDLVVPIDAGRVYEGLSWCMTNGYNCYGIVNTPIVYGSRAIGDWNTANNYGYDIQEAFSNTNFPYSFLFGTGSCADQINTPCHAYDNVGLRTNELATFFSELVSTNPVCDTAIISSIGVPLLDADVSVFPNPFTQNLHIRYSNHQVAAYQILDVLGRVVCSGDLSIGNNEVKLPNDMSEGFFCVSIRTEHQSITKWIIRK